MRCENVKLFFRGPLVYIVSQSGSQTGKLLLMYQLEAMLFDNQTIYYSVIKGSQKAVNKYFVLNDLQERSRSPYGSVD